MAQETKKKGDIHYAWFILVGCIVMMGFMRGGLNNALGQFTMPISQDLGYGLGSLNIMMAISAAVGIFWNPIAGKLMAKYGIRGVVGVALLVNGLSFAALGLMSQLWGFYSFSALMALGSAFTTQMVGPVLINRWFKEKNGMAMGIMMAAVGLFGAVVQPVVAMVITNYGWRMGFISLGLVCVCVTLPVALLLFRGAPADKGLLPYGATEATAAPAAQAAQSAGAAHAIPGITCKRAMKSPAFYFLFLFMAFLTGCAAFGSHVAPVAIEAGFSTQIGGVGLSFWMIGTLLGSLLFGTLTDKLGAQKSAFIALCFGLTAVVILMTLRTNMVAFYIALLLYGFLASTLGTLGPLLTSSLFGYKEFSQIFGYILAAINVASMLLVPVYGFIYDAAKSYQNVFYLILCFFVLDVVFLFLAFRSGKKLKAEF